MRGVSLVCMDFRNTILGKCKIIEFITQNLRANAAPLCRLFDFASRAQLFLLNSMHLGVPSFCRLQDSLRGNDHGVHWSCTSLRKVLGSLRTGMAPHRHICQVEHAVHWLEQTRASHERFRPTLSVGRDGIFVPLRHCVWQEGATATVSVLDRRGKRLGTVYLGHMPEPGQRTLTDQLSTLLKAIVSRVDSQGLRLVYVTDEGYHPSDYYHRFLGHLVEVFRAVCNNRAPVGPGAN